MTTALPVRYTIDAQDRLADLNSAWRLFAEANAGLSLQPSQVLGRPLWDFLTDATTIALYRGMVKRVRDGGMPVRFRFRCDAPTLRRGLGMQITRGEGGSVVFEVTAVWEEMRPEMPLLDPAAPRSDALLSVCSWCSRVHLPEARWVEIEEAVVTLGLFGGAALPRLTHGMCAECSTALLRALESPDAQLESVGDPPG